MSAIYRTDVLWNEWYDQQATSDEKEIYNLIWQHRQFFDDLTLQKGSSTFSIFEDYDKPDLQPFFHNLIVRVAEFKNPNLLASYNSRDHIITVSPKVKTEEYCILHEMIHMFDKTYDGLSGLRDAVRWRLYYSLRNKISGLDQAILDFTKARSLMSINRCPENRDLFRQKHDTLFLLKSFDLDMKMGYQFGTVLGYGYAEKFKYLEKVE